jgi:hypothetical protein
LLAAFQGFWKAQGLNQWSWFLTEDGQEMDELLVGALPPPAYGSPVNSAREPMLSGVLMLLVYTVN